MDIEQNMVFGMCNIWAILRRNVICFYSKKPHLDQLSYCQKFSDMMSFTGELQISLPLFFKNSSNDIKSENFDPL